KATQSGQILQTENESRQKSEFIFLSCGSPLTKKHTDDLSDSDRTDDEGIFFYPIPPF
ncbi:unnamed protein product, partial [Tetraodon nigroviridis]